MTTRILLADDSVTIQKVVELTFMDQDYEVDAVGNGDEAVLRLADELPDLVIADVHMPGASGFEVCREVKHRDESLPVLLLVGTFEPFDEADVSASGADAYLKKPFDSQELLRRVEELLAAVAREREEPERLEEVGEEREAADETLDLEEDAREAAILAPPEEPPAGAQEPEGGEADEAAAVAEEETRLPDVEEGEEEPEVLEVDEDETGEVEDLEPPPAAVAWERPWEAPYPGGMEGPAEEAEAPGEPTPGEETGPEEDEEPGIPGGAEGEEERTPSRLSDEDVDRIARRVLELGGEGVLREVAWEALPDLAEVVIKDRLRELEAEVE